MDALLERGRFGRVLDTLPSAFQHVYLMAVVMVAWVFFRADNLGEAMNYLAAMIGLSQRSADGYVLIYLDLETVVALTAGVTLVVFPKLTILTAPPLEIPAGRPRGLSSVLRDTALGASFFLSIVYVSAQSYNPFIYFRF